MALGAAACLANQDWANRSSKYLSRTTLWAELHSDEQNYTFDPLSDVTRSNWLQVALMSGLPIGIDQHPTDMPSPQ